MSDKSFKVKHSLQLRKLSSEPSGISDGEMYYDSVSNTYKKRQGGVTSTVVGDIDTQTLTNKTIVTPQIDDAATFEHIATPANPASGYNKIYPKADGKFYSLKSDGTETELGAGSGSGGTGNEITETIKNHFIDATFDLATPYIIETDTDSLLDVSSTAIYSSGDKSINFSTAAETLITEQLADSVEYLPNTNALSEAELLAFWKTTNIDTAATYHVSRNGGSEWQAVTMERVGSTEVFRGYHKFTDEVSNQNLVSQTSVDLSRAINITDIQVVSQKFTVAPGTKLLLKNIDVRLYKNSTPSGNYFVSIYSDNAGSPDAVLSQSSARPVSALVAGPQTVNVNIPDIYIADGDYHVVLSTDATYKASYTGAINIAFGARGSGPTAPYVQVYNGTSWSSPNNENLTFEIKGISLDLRVKITSSMASKLDGLALFYDKSVGNVSNGVLNREVFHFSGDDNLNEFTLTQFVPNADLLKAYDVTSGQVYTYGAFSLQGQKVVFDVDQFDSPGNTLTLIFDQTAGGAFDNSDLNGLLLSNNHLGSTDTGIDKSVAGRGIFLRSPNGTLFEITVADDGSIAVYSV